MNTRKIYFPKNNISEKSLIHPQDQYAKNKLITENYLIKNIKKNLLSLRSSNIIGRRIHNNSRQSHKLFFDNFLLYKKQNSTLIVENSFKDFLTIHQFTRILYKILQTKLVGIYNISLSKKIYLSEIVHWLDKKFYKKIKFINSKNNSFTLSNKKLLTKIKIHLTKREVSLFCKNIFSKKN